MKANLGLLHVHLCFGGSRPHRDEDLWKLTSLEHPFRVTPGFFDVATYDVDNYIEGRRDTRSRELTELKLAAHLSRDGVVSANSEIRTIHDSDLEADPMIAQATERLTPENMVPMSTVAIIIPPFNADLINRIVAAEDYEERTALRLQGLQDLRSVRVDLEQQRLGFKYFFLVELLRLVEDGAVIDGRLERDRLFEAIGRTAW